MGKNEDKIKGKGAVNSEKEYNNFLVNGQLDSAAATKWAKDKFGTENTRAAVQREYDKYKQAMSDSTGSNVIINADTPIIPEAQQTYKNDPNAVYNNIMDVAGHGRTTEYNQYAGGLAQNVADAAQTDQMKSKLDPYWNQNHAMDSRRGNLNGMSYGSTLNMSRMADRLNNRVWQKGGSGGYRAIGGPSMGIDRGDWDHKVAPIETQEMRQMRTNERLDERARGYDVDRQNTVLNYGIDQQRAADQVKTSLAQATGMSDIQVNDMIRNAMINTDITMPANTYYAEMLNRFNTYLRLNAQSTAVRYAAETYLQNPALGMMFANSVAGIGQVPSWEEFLNSSIIGGMIKNGTTTVQQSRLLYELLGTQSGALKTLAHDTVI